MLRLSSPSPGRSLREEITPCLSVLWNFSRTSRPARKYLKSIILPPLTAEVVKVKPEDGDSLKGRLVSLMTNSSTGDISNMVAELLYALCKENVGRCVVLCVCVCVWCGVVWCGVCVCGKTDYTTNLNCV